MNPVRIGDATLYLGDSREIVPALDPVDAVITSPPYGQQRDYGSKVIDWRGLVSGSIVPTQDSGQTQVLVNLGLIHRGGSVQPYWDGLIEDMLAAGWRHFGWYVWDQGPGMPGDWQGRLAPSHEFVFHFNRAARKPNKTCQSKYAGHVRNKPQTGMRGTDGGMNGWSHGLAPTQDVKIADSVIRVMRHKHQGGIEAGHPAVFPVALPSELMASYTDPGDVVLDPFMGSGTTGVAAMQMGRKFVGVEIDPSYFDIACRRIEQAYAQRPLFAAEPQAKPEQLGLEGAF